MAPQQRIIDRHRSDLFTVELLKGLLVREFLAIFLEEKTGLLQEIVR
jgi:hypothetical protein